MCAGERLAHAASALARGTFKHADQRVACSTRERLCTHSKSGCTSCWRTTLSPSRSHGRTGRTSRMLPTKETHFVLGEGPGGDFFCVWRVTAVRSSFKDRSGSRHQKSLNFEIFTSHLRGTIACNARSNIPIHKKFILCRVTPEKSHATLSYRQYVHQAAGLSDEQTFGTKNSWPNLFPEWIRQIEML